MTPLVQVVDPGTHGGKAAALGHALRAGLPVPDGFALSCTDVRAVVADPEAVRQRLADALAPFGPVAVRSSALDEDGASASFAGQHRSCLGVEGAEAVLAAIVEVDASARTPAALAYRARLGLAPEASVAVLVQRMVAPTAAGVLFTRDPLTGGDVRVIEASWGLGEAVVGGLVVPDRFVLARDGSVLERALGDKDVEVVAEGGRTRDIDVPPARRHAPCLGADDLEGLLALAEHVERAFPQGRAHDLEFALGADGRLWLLQRREVTR
jgi:pyruvate,water dikinase